METAKNAKPVEPVASVFTCVCVCLCMNATALRRHTRAFPPQRTVAFVLTRLAWGVTAAIQRRACFQIKNSRGPSHARRGIPRTEIQSSHVVSFSLCPVPSLNCSACDFLSPPLVRGEEINPMMCFFDRVKCSFNGCYF